MQNEKKTLIIVLMALIIVIASIGTVAYLIIGVETVERNRSYEYYLTITPNDAGNYTLYVPLAINEDGSVSKLMDDLQITMGNATNEIIETEHGMALKIVTSEDVILVASKKEQISRPYLSMPNSTAEDGVQDPGDLEFWVYCDKSEVFDNITFSLYLSIKSSRNWYNGLGMHKWQSSSDTKEQMRDVTLTQGWQKVPGYISVIQGN